MNTDEQHATAEQMARQARQHVESLRAAGVEWLPAAPRTTAATQSAAVVEAKTFSEPGALATGTAPVADSDGAGTERVADAPGSDGADLERRRLSLRQLADEVAACTRCGELACTRTQTVFGDGPPGVELCFIGEAPGADEDAQGVPFVGAAGQLLNKIIAACGLQREEVYICNILKCRPPGNRTPNAVEAGNCRDFLDRQLELVAPKFICTLGGCAATNLLQTTKSLGQLRGRFHDYRGIPVLCTYHPAYLLPHRSPEKKRDVWEDMKKLLARMGRAVPG